MMPTGFEIAERHHEHLINVAWFCWFWKITPAEYWSLTVAETAAMSEVMIEVFESRQRG